MPLYFTRVSCTNLHIAGPAAAAAAPAAEPVVEATSATAAASPVEAAAATVAAVAVGTKASNQGEEMFLMSFIPASMIWCISGANRDIQPRSVGLEPIKTIMVQGQGFIARTQPNCLATNPPRRLVPPQTLKRATKNIHQRVVSPNIPCSRQPRSPTIRKTGIVLGICVMKRPWVVIPLLSPAVLRQHQVQKVLRQI